MRIFHDVVFFQEIRKIMGYTDGATKNEWWNERDNDDMNNWSLTVCLTLNVVPFQPAMFNDMESFAAFHGTKESGIIE